MATQQTSFRSPKSLVTTTLAGLSVVVLFQGMDQPLSQLSPIATCASSHLLGLLPTIVLAASRSSSSHPKKKPSKAPWPSWSFISNIGRDGKAKPTSVRSSGTEQKESPEFGGIQARG
jgi:hypothetical protein